LTTSPARIVELAQTGSTSVDETTYFGMLVKRSAQGSVRDGDEVFVPALLH
jgi:hypothetical protein